MTTNRFHKAAKDGLIDVLKEATKRECNAKDEQGMTPTLYAAFHGHLEALRVLCGRGGDPDKSDHFGNTALHLAAAQGHKVVVTFLCNFGANIYAMDIDQRTAQDLAGMNNREEILRYMDAFTGKLEASDKKKAKSMKEKAKKDAEKRIKEFSKRQAKANHNERLIKKQNSKEYKPSLVSTLRMKMKSGSMSNLSNGGQTMPRNSFSAIVSGGTVSRNVNSTVQRKVLANKLRNNNDDDDFKISEIEDGKRSVRHIQGLRRDSEVLYGGVLEDTRRGRLDGVFNEAESVLSPNQSNGGSGTLTRSISQPDFMHELEQNEPLHHQPVEPGSIFVRPGIGSLAFRKSITNTLQAMSFAEAAVEESSIGSARFDDDISESEPEEEEEENSAIERFLTAWGLSEYLLRFDEQKIDLDTLLMLTESDLKTLNLPLGPHRKLVNAIAERKAALENPREVTDGKL
ncbi:PREDICTED: Usher syndrome type-1G protein homolog [Nicrophorus vespilloides]|uniref:Usher syndrome type-1G protein homolog n=1 Tax=Nicrophorus vespilloides TaxID=110193 RepID=A0ABM1NAV2_NICVS|nr:PREDICTED: Usher syndrome type-1G protein homolog [Nicrophorus vespilloides]